MQRCDGAGGVGEHLRSWRVRRNLSQLQLSGLAEVSTRHLCFLETGRSRPSREMVLRIASVLEVPLRARNDLLLLAGFAPSHSAGTIDEPPLRPVREALDRVLRGHEPYPAFVIDRGYDVVAANRSIRVLLAGVGPDLLGPRLNVVRVCLHPDGLAPRLANYRRFRENMLLRLHRDLRTTGNESAAALLREVEDYPWPPASGEDEVDLGIATALAIDTPNGRLSFLTTLATFLTASDVTVSELAIESFFPADQATANALSAPFGDDISSEVHRVGAAAPRPEPEDDVQAAQHVHA